MAPRAGWGPATGLPAASRLQRWTDGSASRFAMVCGGGDGYRVVDSAVAETAPYPMFDHYVGRQPGCGKYKSGLSRVRGERGCN